MFREYPQRLSLRHMTLSIFALLLVFGGPLQAQKKKSSLNTNIYEADSSQISVSAKVKIVRDLSGETEVFFEGKHSGPFILPSSLPSYGLLKGRLQKSQKTGGPPVSVVIENDRIKSVEIPEGGTPKVAPKEKDVIDAIFKK